MAGRLPVILVRNPFRRLVSYFRHKWLGNERKDPFTRWSAFTSWLQLMHDHRRSTENTTWGFYSFKGNSPIGANDITHTLSLGELIQDPRWPPSARDALKARLFPLRLEVISSDLERLRIVLCSFYGACQRLPRLPNIVPEGARGSSIRTPKQPPHLWSIEAISIARRMYASDFASLGYSLNPRVSLPVRRPAAWRRVHALLTS